MRVIPGRGWLLASIPSKPHHYAYSSMQRTLEISRWCESQFGECGVRWYANPLHKFNRTWRFRDECDLMMFLIVWG